MTTTNPLVDSRRSHHSPASHAHAPIDYVVPLGRLLFVAIFLMSVPMHFKAQMVDMAGSAGVPLPQIAVPLSGVIALLGGLSVLFGYRARVGAWLIVLFLVPVTVMMHKFWGISDPQAKMMQQIMFMKNVSILGAALMLAYFGSGPFSVDARR
jgi:putative oxidoreductase